MPGHGVHADIHAGQLHGHGLRHVIDGRLGGAVGDLADVGHRAGKGADVHNEATGLRHLAGRGLAAEEYTAHIRIYPGEEVLVGGGEQVPVLGGVRVAEVVHEHVDAALGGHDRIDHRLVALGLARVAVHALHAQALRGQLVGLGLGALHVAGADVGDRPLFRARLHNGRADAARRRRDHHNFILQSHGEVLSRIRASARRTSNFSYCIKLLPQRQPFLATRFLPERNSAYFGLEIVVLLPSAWEIASSAIRHLGKWSHLHYPAPHSHGIWQQNRDF